MQFNYTTSLDITEELKNDANQKEPKEADLVCHSAVYILGHLAGHEVD